MLYRDPPLDIRNEEARRKSYPINMVVLLQLWHKNGNTADEVHGIGKNESGLAILEHAGLEVYIPVDRGFSLTINNNDYTLKPGNAFIVYPDDVHRIKYEGCDDGRMLIMGCCGFSRGTKLQDIGIEACKVINFVSEVTKM